MKQSERNQLKVNGKRLFLNGIAVDGRIPVARQYKHHFETITDQLGGNVTPAQEVLIRRVSMLATQCDMDDCILAGGGDVDAEAYIRRTNALLGLLKQLGLARLPRDITPDTSRRKRRNIDAHTAALIDLGNDANAEE